MPGFTPPDPPTPLTVPSYSEVARRPPMPLTPILAQPATNYVAAIPTALGPRSPYQSWRPPRQEVAVSRPVCYYCGIRGHISRFCRRRQQDERRGYDTYERDNMRFSYGFRQQRYTSPPRRSSSPPGPAEFPRNSRNERRRSPSPHRRAVSPLRPVFRDTSHAPEN